MCDEKCIFIFDTCIKHTEDFANGLNFLQWAFCCGLGIMLIIVFVCSVIFQKDDGYSGWWIWTVLINYKYKENTKMIGQEWIGFKYPEDARQIKSYLADPCIAKELDRAINTEGDDDDWA